VLSKDTSAIKFKRHQPPGEVAKFRPERFMIFVQWSTTSF